MAYAKDDFEINFTKRVNLKIVFFSFFIYCSSFVRKNQKVPYSIPQLFQAVTKANPAQYLKKCEDIFFGWSMTNFFGKNPLCRVIFSSTKPVLESDLVTDSITVLKFSCLAPEVKKCGYPKMPKINLLGNPKIVLLVLKTKIRGQLWNQ